MALQVHVNVSLNRPPGRTWRRPPGRSRNKWLDQPRNDSTRPSVMCVCLSTHIFEAARLVFNVFCMLPMTVARSFSGGVVIRHVLPVLWMTSCLLISKVARRRRSAEAQCTRSLGLGYKLCAVIPISGQRTHWTTFRALKVTCQVATPGAESAVYDWLVSAAVVRLQACRYWTRPSQF